MQDAMLGPGSTETKKPDMAPIVVEFIFNFSLMPKFRNDFFFFAPFLTLTGEMLSYGDKQEVEIRGCTLWCVELIRDCLLELIEKNGEKPNEEINSVLLDYYLWDYARDHREDMKRIPFHRTRCIYY
jgi:hypothetical protein